MKCMTKYVPLDVHQATTVASVQAEGALGASRSPRSRDARDIGGGLF